MSFNLEKGARFNLSKQAPGLSKLHVGLGWAPNAFDTGADRDLDVSIFACAPGVNGAPKIIADPYFVFYGSETKTAEGKPTTPCGGIVHNGDNRTGAGEGDDESAVIDLSKLDPRVTEVSFIVTIYDAEARRQNFGQVSNAYIRLVDEATGAEVARYNLEDDFSTETAVQFGSLFKKDGQWQFKAVGAGYKKGLADFVGVYCQ